jgi:mono/diheme cytochrome c family protein
MIVMRRFHLLTVTFFTGLTIASCDSNTGNDNKATVGANDIGKGKFTEVLLGHPLDKGLVEKGNSIYGAKCAACHKLTEEKLVGPGWKGVTDRRRPEWIMNFVTNTDEMIDQDPTAQALLEKCMVRMPNQHVTDDEARQMLEFMRSNDGKN